MPARPQLRPLLAAVSVLMASALLLPATPAATAAAAPVDPLSEQFNQFLPSATHAVWTYSWADANYSPTPTLEKVTVASNTGPAFQLAWTTAGLGNPASTASAAGQMDFSRTDGGLVNQNWASTPPPPQFPILCAQASGCPNSLSSTLFMLIWGSRAPVLVEPLLSSTEWSSLGGAQSDVSSDNRYLGQEMVKVPAYPQGVLASKVESDITQAGALGDPWGSGIRTTWWVRGVGPVRIDISHTGGDFQQALLQSTNLAPHAPPPDANYFPLAVGQKMVFHWRNSRYMKTWSKQELDVSQSVNNTSRVDVKNLSGPIRLSGAYLFSSRISGITNLSAFTKAATLARFPALGPFSLPAAQRRHFFTPFDLMVYGLNPVLTAYPVVGQGWATSTSGRDFQVYGVRGSTSVVGFARVHVPAGTFNTLVVRSSLSQAGSRFGSGTRMSYFAAGKGLVKLVFNHRDGSVSTVERLP
jgi:hypothetical protein